MAQKMTMALFSGSVDKLTCAGIVLSGAAADDMDVDIFVLLMGAHAFKKENIHEKKQNETAKRRRTHQRRKHSNTNQHSRQPKRQSNNLTTMGNRMQNRRTRTAKNQKRNV